MLTLVCRTRRFQSTLRAVTVLAILALVTTTASAQRGQRGGRPPVIVTGATIHTATGEVIENGTIVVVGGKIRAIGTDLQVPPGAEVIDATGKTIIPGIIDADSSLTVVGTTNARKRTDARVLDAVDPFARNDMTAALSNGVTSAFVSPPSNGGIYGLGAVLKLDPNRPLARRVLAEEAALCSSVGSTTRLGPLLRLKELDGIAAQMKSAEAYREAREDYEEKLEEYREEIEKRQKENGGKEGEEKKEDDKKEDEKKADEKKEDGDAPQRGPRGPRRGPRRPPEDGSVELGLYLVELLFGREALDAEVARKKADASASSDSREDGDVANDDLNAYEREMVEHFSDAWAARAADPPKKEGEGDKSKESGDKKSEKDDLKKPKEPARNAAKEVLLRVINREIPLRVEAHRASDILNLLALTEEYPFDLTIVGATEAYKVRDALAKADVRVIVDGGARDPRRATGKYRGTHAGNAAALAGSGVSVAIGSGRIARHSPHLWLAAAHAAANGLSSQDALAAVTRRAAEAVGVSDRIGTLEAGKDADMVILSGSPFAGDTVVEAVYIEGRQVYSNN